jgi:hypothetical protein
MEFLVFLQLLNVISLKDGICNTNLSSFGSYFIASGWLQLGWRS